MKKAWVLRVLFPLFAGGLVYVLFRPLAQTVLFRPLEKDLAQGAVPALRQILSPLALQLPEWLRYSLPDGLWCYACISMVLILWNRGPRLYRALWLGAAMILCLGFELGQLTHVVPGTFCPRDFLLSLAAVLTALNGWPCLRREAGTLADGAGTGGSGAKAVQGRRGET